MILIKRTNSADKDFIRLVRLLDSELTVRDGEEHGFYDQFNKIDKIKHTVVFYKDGKPVACGAIKEYDRNTMEIKRMFTRSEMRGSGIASKVLGELEKWAAELSYEKCILETGIRQPEAIRLYEKNGYISIPNYGQYAGIANSRCFEKRLK
ncbi:MAG: GNAT family N-acetyltransferase [Flavobacteriaceae bacterium]|nr:GNAT family N-acetyltransferase [Flavobacteriaceae bacterium]MCB0475390.1 GNAT family N-acetyltransferase [Flavobacteriaceae bacterium]